MLIHMFVLIYDISTFPSKGLQKVMSDVHMVTSGTRTLASRISSPHNDHHLG